MRAVVLSDDRIIEFLNENFINTWITNSELGRVPSLRDPIAKRREREGKTFDTSHPLAQAIMKGWKKHSPADCLVISPAFELMGRQPVNELFSGDFKQRYLTFLQESLAGKLPGLGEDTSVPLQTPDSEGLVNSGTAAVENVKAILTREKPAQQVLNTFRTPEAGYQDYTVVEIDATAFKEGGVLTIDISVGSADPAGSFDLFDSDTELPTEGVPHEALTSAWDIPPSSSGIIMYQFNQGKVFKLGATGSWFSEKGSINAFIAQISVEPVSEEKNEH